jgi:hypothetical protein
VVSVFGQEIVEDYITSILIVFQMSFLFVLMFFDEVVDRNRKIRWHLEGGNCVLWVALFGF